MIRWKCFELHTHTLASDGKFTLAELRAHAGDFLYDGIALTDHNTMSALDELTGEAPAKGVPVIPGIEWTTYYGHMVVIGADRYIDWRFARPDTIDEYTAAIKEAGGLTGIAHPFELGSPMCTGCYWDFKVKNWNNIDYIEVWSEPFPQRHLKNEGAFAWWTKLLDQGHRLAATSGWDWHRLEPGKPVLPAATWLGLQDDLISTATVREALGAGRTIVSIGPFPNLALHQGEKTFYPGDTLEQGGARLSITLDEEGRKKIWGSFGIHTKRLCVVQNGKTVKEISPASGSSPGETELKLSPGWVRIEGYGTLEGEKDILLFFSSPWYVM